MTKIHTFIATHKEIGYEIPFPHILIGMDGYNSNGAVDASKYIPEYMSRNRVFASYRAGWCALEYIKNSGFQDSDFLAVWSYRSFFGNKFHNNFMNFFKENTSSDSVDSIAFRNFQTPKEIQDTWKSKILINIPEDVELITTRPIDFGMSVMEHYATYHHLDDLMYGVGLAIRLWFIDQKVTAHVLSNSIFISGFIGRVSFYRDLYDKLFLIAEELYKKHYILRVGYQERSINFVLERIVSIFLMQKIYYENIPATNVNIVQISENGTYTPGA